MPKGGRDRKGKTMTVKLTREGQGSYTYTDAAGSTYSVFRFMSAYGDIQWRCDVERPNGPASYWQADTLGEIRVYIADEVASL